MFGTMSHPNTLQRLCHRGLAIARAHPAICQRQLDVLVNREIANEVEALENEPDFPIANAGTLRKGKVGDL